MHPLIGNTMANSDPHGLVKLHSLLIHIFSDNNRKNNKYHLNLFFKILLIL